MFDKEIAVAATTPNHYHTGSTNDGGLFNTTISRAVTVSVNGTALYPPANTVIPANT